MDKVMKLTQEEKDRLVVQHMSKMKNTVRNFVDRGECEAEITSEVFYGFVKALDNYDEVRGTDFYAFANKCIMNQVLQHLREKSSLEKHAAAKLIRDIEITMSDNTYERLLMKETKAEVLTAVSNLPGKEQSVIELLFGIQSESPFDQKETAHILGCTQAYISKLNVQARKKLLRNLHATRRDLEA